MISAEINQGHHNVELLYVTFPFESWVPFAAEMGMTSDAVSQQCLLEFLLLQSRPI
jgi:hypothetical protein